MARRAFLSGGAAAGLGVALGLTTSTPAAAVTEQPAARQNTGDLLLINGRIHTMDEHDRVVSSVLIRGGRFAAVDDKATRPAAARVVDLGGRTVIPGLVDLHNHICLVGNRPGYHQPLDHLRSLPAILAALARRRCDVPEGQFVTCIGLVSPDHIAPEHRLPTLAQIDSVVPDRGVYLQAGFLGPSVTNSVGRQWLEPKGVVVGRDGVIDTVGAHLALAELRSAFLTPESRRRSALDALRHFASLGVTTCVDAGAVQSTGCAYADTILSGDTYYAGSDTSMYTAFLSLHAHGLLPARLWLNFLHLEADGQGLVDMRARLKMAFPFFGDEWMSTGGIGEFYAGGVAGALAIARAGWRVEQHVMLPGEIDRFLTEWEIVNAQAPIIDLRWVIAHALPQVTPRQAALARTLGVGFHIFGCANPSVASVGSETVTVPFFTNWKDILDSGAHVGFHSDSGDIPYTSPFVHLYHFITGKNSRGELVNDGQQLTRHQAMELATSRARWFMNGEPLGSIAVGDYADLAVLTHDYFTVPADKIPDIRSDLTIVNGKIVHDAGVL